MLFDLQKARRSQEFGGFIHGPELAGAVLAARRAACGETSAYLWGKPGTGKSHLLCAAAKEAGRNGVTMLPVGGRLPDKPSLAVIDDIEDLEPDVLQWLFETLRAVLQGDSPTCVLASGSTTPATIGLRDDIRSRLQELPCFHLHALTDESLILALCNHAQRLGRKLPQPVAEILVERLPRDMASLAAAMDELDLHAISNDIKLSAASVRKWLDDKEQAA